MLYCLIIIWQRLQCCLFENFSPDDAVTGEICTVKLEESVIFPNGSGMFSFSVIEGPGIIVSCILVIQVNYHRSSRAHFYIWKPVLGFSCDMTRFYFPNFYIIMKYKTEARVGSQ